MDHDDEKYFNEVMSEWRQIDEEHVRAVRFIAVVFTLAIAWWVWISF